MLVLRKVYCLLVCMLIVMIGHFYCRDLCRSCPEVLDSQHRASHWLINKNFEALETLSTMDGVGDADVYWRDASFHAPHLRQGPNQHHAVVELGEGLQDIVILRLFLPSPGSKALPLVEYPEFVTDVYTMSDMGCQSTHNW